jgi:ERF superfamily protein
MTAIAKAEKVSTTLFDPKKDEVPLSATTELVTHTLPPESAVELTPMLLIDRALERGHDPGKLYELAQQWKRDIAAERFATQLARFQAACPQIQKTRQIDLGGGKGPLYASLDDIMHQIKPLLAECGLAVTYSAGITDGGQLTAKCLIHHGTHVEESEITLPVPSQMRVNDTQKMGAALSYAKRYALCAALNIIVSDEDRDGEGLCETIDEDHVASLREWIADTESNEAAFLKFMGVKSLAEIPAKDFAKAFEALKRKAKR